MSDCDSLSRPTSGGETLVTVATYMRGTITSTVLCLVRVGEKGEEMHSVKLVGKEKKANVHVSKGSFNRSALNRRRRNPACDS